MGPRRQQADGNGGRTAPRARAGETVLVDARGLVCPLPLMELRRALVLVAAGTRLCLLATDPQAPADVEAFCEASGHRLIGLRESEGAFAILVEKCG